MQLSARAATSMLFGFRQPVARATYAAAGIPLFLLKYGVDLALSASFASNALDPITYLNPLLSQRIEALGLSPNWLPGVMFVWALPFIWIGVSMSARRAVDAGLSAWLSLLFFLPVLNYLLIAGLCAAPRVRDAYPGGGAEVRDAWTQSQVAGATLGQLRVATLSVLAAAAFGSLAAIFSVFGFQQYGSALFVGAPFMLGVISGVLFNRTVRQPLGATIAAAALSVTLSGGVLLLLALEGVLCLAMAAVIAYPSAMLGAVLGRALARGQRPREPTLSMLVAWPLVGLMPWDLMPWGTSWNAPWNTPWNTAERFPVRATVSAIEIDAPPEEVWDHVIGFPPLPPPDGWLMRSGVACPLSARIEGEGVGAIRYCEFTTGPFVEPITAWEPPYRLAFDVSEQPPSMREWSPYEVVHAPHLHGGVQSLRGEFALTRLEGDRTRLQGTTWYRLKMTPQPYWSLYADHAIHVIHERVLAHIRALSESSSGRAAALPGTAQPVTGRPVIGLPITGQPW